MMGWLQRRPAQKPQTPPPAREAPLPIIRLRGGNLPEVVVMEVEQPSRPRIEGLVSVEDVMSAAVAAALVEGIHTADPRMGERIKEARAELRQARATALAESRQVVFNVGTRSFAVTPARGTGLR